MEDASEQNNICEPVLIVIYFKFNYLGLIRKFIKNDSNVLVNY